MNVDDVFKSIPVNEFAFFHIMINVAGMNMEVFQGARETLKKCKVICIEYDSETEKEEIN